jgi:DNA-binding MarR family transcriptional regulator
MTDRDVVIGQAAADLRATLGRLIRRLRAAGILPLGQAGALGRLEREGPRTTSALAAAERVRPQSMAQTVKELERLGYVTRRPDPDDGRQFLLELTDTGRAAILAERASRESWLAEAIASELDPEEQETLIRAVALLGRISQER